MLGGVPFHLSAWWGESVLGGVQELPERCCCHPHFQHPTEHLQPQLDSASLCLAAMWTLPPESHRHPKLTALKLLPLGSPSWSKVLPSPQSAAARNPGAAESLPLAHSLSPPPISISCFKSSSSAYPIAPTCMWSWHPHPQPCPPAGPSDATTAISKPAPCCQKHLSKMQI